MTFENTSLKSFWFSCHCHIFVSKRPPDGIPSFLSAPMEMIWTRKNKSQCPAWLYSLLSFTVSAYRSAWRSYWLCVLTVTRRRDCHPSVKWTSQFFLERSPQIHLNNKSNKKWSKTLFWINIRKFLPWRAQFKTDQSTSLKFPKFLLLKQSVIVDENRSIKTFTIERKTF